MQGKWKQTVRQHLPFILFFVLCNGIFLWRCFYSINYYDEPYGIAVIWRYFKGGAILAEDWHPSQQLTAWLLYPLYRFLYTILDGNDGMILGFRIAYVAMQGIFTCYCYYRLRNYGWYAATAGLLFMFSTHNNMTTINYNTIGIGCMMVLMVTLFTEENYHRGTLILCGILTAIVVLAQPFTILLFILWGMIALIATVFGRGKELPMLLRFRNYFYVGLGAIFVLIAFLLVVFSRAELGKILTGIYYNLNDPEHAMDLSYKVSKYFERFYRYYKYQVLMMAVSVVIGCLPKRTMVTRWKAECVLLSAAAFVYSLIAHGCLSDYVPIDFLSVPMAFFGLSIFAVTEKKNWKLFLGWVLPAMCYTFCVQLATDTGILAVSAATIIASSGGVLLIAEAIRAQENETLRRWLGIVFFALNCFQAVLFLNQRVCYTWWSAPVSECTELVTEGPAKGIRTTKEDLSWYTNALREIDSLKLTKEDHLLVLEHATWLYLYADVPVATYSFWSVGEENYLKEYYEQFEDKRPTVVYTLDVEGVKEKSYTQEFLAQGYEYMEFESGNISLRK